MQCERCGAELPRAQLFNGYCIDCCRIIMAEKQKDEPKKEEQPKEPVTVQVEKPAVITEKKPYTESVSIRAHFSGYCPKCGNSGNDLTLFDGVCGECWQKMHPGYELPINIIKQEKPAEAKPAPVPKQKGRVFAFLTMALTVAYALYIISYFYDAASSNFVGVIANAMVMPHMICAGLSAVFSVVGFFAKARWGMLATCICMALAAVVFPMYAAMVLVQALLALIAYIRMGKTS